MGLQDKERKVGGDNKRADMKGGFSPEAWESITGQS